MCTTPDRSAIPDRDVIIRARAWRSSRANVAKMLTLSDGCGRRWQFLRVQRALYRFHPISPGGWIFGETRVAVQEPGTHRAQHQEEWRDPFAQVVLMDESVSGPVSLIESQQRFCGFIHSAIVPQKVNGPLVDPLATR